MSLCLNDKTVSPSLHGRALAEFIATKFDVPLKKTETFPTFVCAVHYMKQLFYGAQNDPGTMHDQNISIIVKATVGTCYLGTEILFFNPYGLNNICCVLLDRGHSFEKSAAAASRNGYILDNPSHNKILDHVSQIDKDGWRFIQRMHQNVVGPNDYTRFGRLMSGAADPRFQQPVGSRPEGQKGQKCPVGPVVQLEVTDGEDGSGSAPPLSPQLSPAAGPSTSSAIGTKKNLGPGTYKDKNGALVAEVPDVRLCSKRAEHEGGLYACILYDDHDGDHVLADGSRIARKPIGKRAATPSNGCPPCSTSTAAPSGAETDAATVLAHLSADEEPAISHPPVVHDPRRAPLVNQFSDFVDAMCHSNKTFTRMFLGISVTYTVSLHNTKTSGTFSLTFPSEKAITLGKMKAKQVFADYINTDPKFTDSVCDSLIKEGPQIVVGAHEALDPVVARVCKMPGTNVRLPESEFPVRGVETDKELLPKQLDTMAEGEIMSLIHEAQAALVRKQAQHMAAAQVESEKKDLKRSRDEFEGEKQAFAEREKAFAEKKKEVDDRTQAFQKMAGVLMNFTPAKED